MDVIDLGEIHFPKLEEEPQRYRAVLADGLWYLEFAMRPGDAFNPGWEPSAGAKYADKNQWVCEAVRRANLLGLEVV